MAVKTESTVINGVQYNVTQLFADEALLIQLELTNLVGGEIARLFGDIGKLSDLLKDLDPVKALALAKKLIHSDKVSKKVGDVLVPVSINDDFSGDLKGLYTLLFFVIEVNFKSFFLDAIPYIGAFLGQIIGVKQALVTKT